MPINPTYGLITPGQSVQYRPWLQDPWSPGAPNYSPLPDTPVSPGINLPDNDNWLPYAPDPSEPYTPPTNSPIDTSNSWKWLAESDALLRQQLDYIRWDQERVYNLNKAYARAQLDKLIQNPRIDYEFAQVNPYMANALVLFMYQYSTTVSDSTKKRVVEQWLGNPVPQQEEKIGVLQLAIIAAALALGITPFAMAARGTLFSVGALSRARVAQVASTMAANEARFAKTSVVLRPGWTVAASKEAVPHMPIALAKVGQNLLPGLVAAEAISRLDNDFVTPWYIDQEGVINVDTNPAIEFPTDEVPDNKVVPVPIRTPAHEIRLNELDDGVEIRLTPNRNPSIKTWTMSPSLRPHGNVATQPYLPRAVALQEPQVTAMQPIPQSSISLVIENNQLTIKFRRDRNNKKRSRDEENTRRKDRKSYSQLAYLAALRMTNRTFGRVSEVLDFVDAIQNNIMVKVGGFWYNLGTLTLAKEKAIYDLNAAQDYQVDFEGMMYDLLANEIIDHTVARLKQGEKRELRRMGIFQNMFGSASTWYGRL